MEFTSEGRTVLRRRAAGWLPAMVAACLISVLAITGGITAAALLIGGERDSGLVLAVLTVWTLVLAEYVWRDCTARRSWVIEFEPGKLSLNLPAGRALMQRLAREHGDIDISDLATIDTRLEAFRSFGLATIHRSYGLRLRTGQLIVLGEDRALATDLADETVGQIVDLIALKTGLPVRDLGMVEGKGGVLGVLFTSVSGWSEPGLPPARQARLWRRAGATVAIAGLVTLAALILSAAP
jgi:hypothetical protein